MSNECMSVSPAEHFVPIDDMFGEMMNWAVRYALGRCTYAASDTACYVIRLVSKLDSQTLVVIRNDIQEAIKNDNLGMACDAVYWRTLCSMVVEELSRRDDEWATS